MLAVFSAAASQYMRQEHISNSFTWLYTVSFENKYHQSQAETEKASRQTVKKSGLTWRNYDKNIVLVLY